MQITTIFLDLDGLILDSEKIYIKFWLESSRRLGYSLTRNDCLRLRSCDSGIAEKIVTDITGDLNAYSKIRELRKELMSSYLSDNSYELKKGVEDFLHLISKTDLKKGIITSSNIDEKKEILFNLSILDYFDFFISAKSVNRGKPYPDIYLFAMKSMGLLANECVAIEDSPNGVQSAFDAGIKVIMVPDLSEPTELDKERAIICTNILDSIKYIV